MTRGFSEEEKVRVAVVVAKSRLSYCDALARQDFDLMKEDELCQIEKAPKWLRERVDGEFKEREEEARKQIIDSVSTCIIDPKKCDCSQILVAEHSQSCEVKKALAIRCEYENDEEACADLSSEKLEDFLPEFIGEEGKATVLEHLRKKEQEMFERFKPEECKGLSVDECGRIIQERIMREQQTFFPAPEEQSGGTSESGSDAETAVNTISGRIVATVKWISGQQD